MALIKCRDCGREISDKCGVCVNCGCPIGTESIKTEVEGNDSVEKDAYERNDNIIASILRYLGFAALIIGFIVGIAVAGDDYEFNAGLMLIFWAIFAGSALTLFVFAEIIQLLQDIKDILNFKKNI